MYLECWMVGCSNGIQDSAIAWASRVGYRVDSVRSRYRRGGGPIYVEFDTGPGRGEALYS